MNRQRTRVSTPPSTRPREHVVVLGAGVAGLLTGSVLAGAFERVTIVERDAVPTDDSAPDARRQVPRRGVPQGRHAHALLGRGLAEIDALLPGFSAGLLADGATRVVPGWDQRYVLGGRLLARADTGAPTVQATRPLIEHHLRRRLLDRANVRFATGHDVVGLVAADDGARCVGVRLVDRTPGATPETMSADLVVDAMGRGSRLLRWLEDQWSVTVPTEELGVGVTYVTRAFQVGGDLLPGASSVLVGPHPGNSFGAVALAVEGGRHLVTVAGLGGHRPPDDDVGFARMVRDIVPPETAAAIDAGRPDGPIATYRFPAVVRRRFEAAVGLPRGVIAVGDAACAFNPIYAQGMSVAALEAAALREIVADSAEGIRDDSMDLDRRYLRAAARILDVPWQMGVDAVLGSPEADAPRGVRTRLTQALSRRVERVAADDEVVARRFIRVIGMIDPPSALARPSTLVRLFRPRRRTSRSPHGAVRTRSAIRG